MRSIGRSNIELVKRETEKAVRGEGNFNVEDLVVCRLPESLWDSWEGADAEIRRIISDTILSMECKV